MGEHPTGPGWGKNFPHLGILFSHLPYNPPVRLRLVSQIILKCNQYLEEKTGIGKGLSGKELQYESDIYIPGTVAPDTER